MTKLRLLKKEQINKKKLLFWGVLTIVYFARLLYIDSDVRAPWGVLNYQPFDEGCYGALALHKINFGTMNPNNFYSGTYEYLMVAHVINNLIGNVFSYFTMIIFGDNYLGFRLGPVIAGYIVTILFVLILKEFMSKYNKKENLKSKLTFYFFITYLILNFVFYNASRIVEPTLYRLLFLQLIIYIFVKEDIPENVRSFLVGFLSVFSVFFVYITNLFIGVPIAAILFLYLLNHEAKKAKQYFTGCFIGGVLAYILAFIYYYFVWNTTPIKNALNAIFSFQGVAGYNIAGASVWDTITSFLSSNIFLYNPILIAVFFLAMPYFIYKIIYNKNKDVLFLLFIILGLFMQTLISEDYIVRKSLLIFPAILYLNFIYIIADDNADFKYHKKWLYPILGVGVIAFQIYCVMYRIFYIENGTNLDFSTVDTVLVFVLTGLSVCYILYKILIDKMKSHTIKLFYFCLIGTIMVNFAFIFKYNLYKNTYSDKEIMLRLGEIADGEIVCFSYDNSNSLYNNILPLMCSEEQILEYMKENPDIYYYGFDDFPTFNLNEDSLNQHVELYYRFEREFETFGEKRRFALFRYKERE